MFNAKHPDFFRRTVYKLVQNTEAKNYLGAGSSIKFQIFLFLSFSSLSLSLKNKTVNCLPWINSFPPIWLLYSSKMVNFLTLGWVLGRAQPSPRLLIDRSLALVLRRRAFFLKPFRRSCGNGLSRSESYRSRLG